MQENLYEILEVSEKASKEVIDKVYHLLAKKYHPDVQPKDSNFNAEKKMQEINEAYEILSNQEKRDEYDRQLQEQRDLEKKLEIEEIERRIINSYWEDAVNESQIDDSENDNYNNNYQDDYEINEVYNNIKTRYKQPKSYKRKKYMQIIKAIIILAIIIIILWVLPPTNKIIVGFYEDNIVIKAIVDSFVSIFK